MKTSLNLLPQRHRRWLVVRLRLARWIVAWTIAIVVGALAWWVCWAEVDVAATALAARRQEVVPLKQVQVEIETLKKEIETLEAEAEQLAELTEERPMVTLLGAVSRSAAECGGPLQVERLEVRPPGRGGRGRQATPAPSRQVLTLRGVARDNLTVARFVAGLRDAGLFGRVDLKESVEQTARGKRGRHYIVECEL